MRVDPRKRPQQLPDRVVSTLAARLRELGANIRDRLITGGGVHDRCSGLLLGGWKDQSVDRAPHTATDRVTYVC